MALPKRTPILLLGFFIAWVVPVVGQLPYPTSQVDTVIDRYAGIEIADPYRWLEDQESPATRAWIDAQNAFQRLMMADLPGQEVVAGRLGELLKVDVQGTPIVRGDRYFFTKRDADQDLFVIYMREGLAGEDVPLIDPHIMATDLAKSVGIRAITEDGSILAYGIRQGGQDEVAIRFFDVNRHRVMADDLERARYFGVAFTPDNAGIYFTRFTPEDGPRVYYRDLGAPMDSERLVFGEGLGPEKIAFAQPSKDGRHLLVTVLEGTSGGNDLYLKDLMTDAEPVMMVEGAGNNYQASFAGNQIVIQTDWEAPNGRVMVAALEAPLRSDWREIVPEHEHVIEDFSLAAGYVWLNYLENVVGRVRGFDLDGKHFRDLEMPSLGSISGLAGGFDRDEAFYRFTSYNMPATTYRYSVAADERSVWSRPDIPFESNSFEVKQVWYESSDGTRVPMFIAHRKGLELNGDNPTYLTGYGGFNISRTPAFSSQHAVWMERGGVLAVPNLRGGGEFGEAWHEAGMFENKQNVFDDFITAAEWLIENRYTNPAKLAIAGGSNGGLLVGAAVTQRPDLFGAVVVGVPLLDMLRYHKFLAGPYWVSEYGSADDPDQFEYLRAYSPYHNVTVGTEYPAVFFETGDGDTRVAPLHARKMTALMQASTGSDKPILLRYDTEAGHSGGMPVNKTIENVAARLSFVMWQLGMLEGITF